MESNLLTRYGEYSFCICRRQGYYIATQLAGVQFGVNSFGYFFFDFPLIFSPPCPVQYQVHEGRVGLVDTICSWFDFDDNFKFKSSHDDPF